MNNNSAGTTAAEGYYVMLNFLGQFGEHRYIFFIVCYHVSVQSQMPNELQIKSNCVVLEYNSIF